MALFPLRCSASWGKLLAGALLTGCRPGARVPEAPSAAVQPVAMGIDWYPEAEFGGFYQAMARSFYREAGLAVTLNPGGPNTHSNVDLVKGSVQFVSAASDDVIEREEQGVPLLIVGAFMERYPEVILVRADSPVRSLRDLDGRTVIADPGAGWVTNVERRYRIRINISPGDYEVTRFMADPTVIQQVYLTNEPYYIRKQGIKVRAIELADDDYNPYRVIVTTKSYAHDHPETVRRFVAASARGWNDFIFRDAAPGRDLILALNAETTREFVDASIATLRSEHIIDGSAERGEAIGALSLDRLQRQINRLAQIGYIKAPFPVADVATTEFLPR